MIYILTSYIFTPPQTALIHGGNVADQPVRTMQDQRKLRSASGARAQKK